MPKQIQKQKVSVQEQQNKIQIELQCSQPYYRFRGVYSYQQLPIQFRVLFENIRQFYNFLLKDTKDQLKIQNNLLFIVVNVAGKMKEFRLPLTPIQLTPEQQLKKTNYDLQQVVKGKDHHIQSLEEELKRKNKIIQDLVGQSDRFNEKLRNKEVEIKRLNMMIKDISNRSLDQEEKGDEAHVPTKRAGSKKSKDLQTFGSKILFKVDPLAKHYQKFKISNNGNQVEKLHGPTYQLYHKQALPPQGKYYFDVRVILIKNNNIVVGVITQKNKDEQFSFKKMNCVCYNGYDGSICEQDKQNYVNIKPKETNKIRTVVDMTQGIIQWYIMGQVKSSIGTATIPSVMIKQQLFPYFELYWQHNKVKLNN